MDKPQQNETLEEVKDKVKAYKKQYEEILREQQDLRASSEDRQKLAEDFRRRTEKITQSMKDEESFYEEKLNKEKAVLKELAAGEEELLQTIEATKAALQEQKLENGYLRQQTNVFAALPERNVVFKGVTGRPDSAPVFDIDPRIVYPMDGGTALITFEEKIVARHILDMKTHLVPIGDDCRITVEAKPVHLLMPKQVEIHSQVCPFRILVSNLPRMDTDTLLSKLEIHFSKTRNGGGEVEVCELMADTWTVVITFLHKDIAEHLAATEYHEVKLDKTKHRVRVTPFIKGNITNLLTQMSVCQRTVLLTGIPDIMDQGDMQDNLEIHFQKPQSSGGEIEAILYNPVGQETYALFVDASIPRATD